MDQKHSHFLRLSIGAFVVSLILGTYAVAVGVSSPPEFDPVRTDLRSTGEFRSDMKLFMKLSKDDDPQIQRNAVYNLCLLHSEVVQHPRFETSQMIQGFRVVIAGRLKKYAKEVERLERRKQRLEKVNRSASRQAGETDDWAVELNPATAPMASAEIPLETGDETAAKPDSELDAAMLDSSSNGFYAMGRFCGGPNQLFAYSGGRFAPPWDHGPELVALIRNTIDPSSWRNNGGSGSIHYYRPLRVLVISASTGVQQDTYSLLNKLRDAGQ